MESTMSRNSRAMHKIDIKNRFIGDAWNRQKHYVTVDQEIVSENWVTVEREIIIENWATDDGWNRQRKLINELNREKRVIVDSWNHSFETWPGQVIGSRVRWGDPGQPKKKTEGWGDWARETWNRAIDALWILFFFFFFFWSMLSLSFSTLSWSDSSDCACKLCPSSIASIKWSPLPAHWEGF